MAATVKRNNIVPLKPKTNNQKVASRAQWYRFNDRDSELNELCELIVQSGLDPKEIADQVIKQSGGGGSISTTTINRWLSGETRKAYNIKMKWVGFVLGKRREWVDI